MSQTHTRPPSLESLALHWCSFAAVLVAFARELLAFERSGARTAYRKAEELEVMAWMSLCTLTHQLETYEPRSRAEEEACFYLRGYVHLLLALASLGRRIRQRLAAREHPATHLSSESVVSHNGAPSIVPCIRPSEHARAAWYRVLLA